MSPKTERKFRNGGGQEDEEEEEDDDDSHLFSGG